MTNSILPALSNETNVRTIHADHYGVTEASIFTLLFLFLSKTKIVRIICYLNGYCYNF